MSNELEKKTPAKRTGRRYASVAELMRIEGVSPEVQSKYDDINNETRIVQQLARLRQQSGLTQEEMAKRLDVSQSAVSKLESGRDEELTIAQIREYAKASGERICVIFGKPHTHVEAVKLCADGMRHHLSSLAGLAHNGEEMEKEIRAFFGEAFFNILNILAGCQNEMPNSEKIEVRLEVLGNSTAEKRNFCNAKSSRQLAVL